MSPQTTNTNVKKTNSTPPAEVASEETLEQMMETISSDESSDSPSEEIAEEVQETEAPIAEEAAAEEISESPSEEVQETETSSEPAPKPSKKGSPKPAPKKANGKTAPKPTKKTTAEPAAEEITAENTEKPEDLSDKDVNRLCTEITDLYNSSDRNGVENMFECGRRLQAIKKGTTNKTYMHVVKTKLLEASGKTMSASWITKARRYFLLFEDTPERGKKVGMRKTDVVLKMKKFEEALEFLKNGTSAKKNGEKVTVFPEEMSVAQLKTFVDKRNEKYAPKETAEELAVKTFKRIVKALEKFVTEEGDTILHGKFGQELANSLQDSVATMNGSRKSLLDIFKARAAKATKKTASKK